MPTFQNIAVSTLTGILIAIGFWVFIDGAIVAKESFPIFHIIPTFLIIISMFAINLSNPSQIEKNSAIRCYIFFWFTIAMVAIGISIWITAVEYPAPMNSWPGVSIILQTMLIFMAGILYFIGRKTSHSFDF